MQFQKLKQQSVKKILLRGKSGRGKTLTAAKIALMLAEQGAEILYIDTEAEGSNTLVNLVESEETEFTEETVEPIEYVRADDFDQLMNDIHAIEGRQTDFDLVIIDTLDHKHSFVLKNVTGQKRSQAADWQEYAAIYADEKEVMEQIGKAKTNILATIDPDSGSMDKPKGAQTNVHGYFSIVVDLKKADGGWSHKIRNWVNRDDLIGRKVPDLPDALTKELKDCMEL